MAGHPQGALASLREMNVKYKTGSDQIVIADTPNNPANFSPDQIGKPLDGPMRLEVPVQTGVIPQKVIDMANKFDIKIVDLTGEDYVG